MPQKFSARTWFERGTRTAQPSRNAILAMLGEIEQDLRAAKLEPVALTVTTFPPGTFFGTNSAKHLAVISVTAEPGELKRSLVCWYEWQHPQWRFAGAGDEVLALPAAGAVS